MTKRKKFQWVLTSGMLHKMPQSRYILELICGKVADTGDLTNPSSWKKKKRKKEKKKPLITKSNINFPFFKKIEFISRWLLT